MIFIIRHGETQKNKKKLLQGRSNDPLNEAGSAQAEQAREDFQNRGVHFVRVDASTLIRAVDTAQIIVGDTAQIITDDRLLEMDYGPYEGTSLEPPPPEVLHFFMDFVNHPAPEGMESLECVVERLGEFMEEILPAAAEGGDILISTHAIAMKGALEYLTPASGGAYWSKYIGNCEVYQIGIRDGRYLVPEETGMKGK